MSTLYLGLGFSLVSQVLCIGNTVDVVGKKYSMEGHFTPCMHLNGATRKVLTRKVLTEKSYRQKILKLSIV